MQLTLITPGVFRYPLQVKIDGVIIQTQIDINATCIENSRYLVNQVTG